MTVTRAHLGVAVVPVSGPPIEAGAVAVSRGRIVDVGRACEVLERHPGAEEIEWPGVIMPGLVNAHTHLQYGSFRQVDPAPDFVTWSARFVEESKRRGHDDWGAVARQGVEIGLSHGTTCFADVVTDLGALDTLAAKGVAGVSYVELIGVGEPAWSDVVGRDTRSIVAGAVVGEHTRVGISPHAPYSVDEPVLVGAASLARDLGVRLHLHLAESDTEDAFYRSGTGALAERVAGRVGRPWQDLGRGGKGMGAAAFARACGLLGPDSHVAHGVYLGEEGRRVLRETSTYVALCPRSNRNVGVDPPPVADFLRERNLIAVGTDSLASTPSLDVMADLRLLRELALTGGYTADDLDRRLIHAATLGGARALGLADALGSLEVGKRADLAVFDVAVDPGSIEAALAGTGACIATVVAGEIRHRALR